MTAFWQVVGLLVLAGLLYILLLLKRSTKIPILPCPSQEPWYKRLFVEPDPPQLERWAKEIPNDGLISYRGILNKQRILVTSSAGVRDVFQTQAYVFRKPAAISKILRSVIGDGLVTAEGDAHRAQRKLLQPVFKLRQIRNLYPLFWSKTKELVSVLQQQACEGSGTVTFEIADLMSRVTLDVIGAAGFGVELKTLQDPRNEFYRNYMLAFVPSRQAQLFRLLALFLPAFILDILPLRRNQELRQATRAVRELIRNTIAEQKADLNPGEKGNGLENTRNDIVSVMMETGGIDDVDTLVNQSLTFLGAGHDTVGQSMNWAIYELVCHPDIQKRLREEVIAASPGPLTDSDLESATLERIENLPYLSAFCNEVFRLHPPIHHLHRQSIQPVRVAGVELPKGATLVTSIRSFNRSSELWNSDPAVFYPERWLRDANGGSKAKEAFLSFNFGPRSCIGERFGRAEMVFLIAGLVGGLKMMPCARQVEEPVLEYGTVTRFARELEVRVKGLDA